jgi:hypothetical protein
VAGPVSITADERCGVVGEAVGIDRSLITVDIAPPEIWTAAFWVEAGRYASRVVLAEVAGSARAQHPDTESVRLIMGRPASSARHSPGISLICRSGGYQVCVYRQLWSLKGAIFPPAQPVPPFDSLIAPLSGRTRHRIVRFIADSGTEQCLRWRADACEHARMLSRYPSSNPPIMNTGTLMEDSGRTGSSQNAPARGCCL